MTNQLRWKPTSDYHAVSECGNYHLSLAVIGEMRIYDSWYGSMAGGNLRHLHSGKKDAAIQACETDIQQQRQSAASGDDHGR